MFILDAVQIALGDADGLVAEKAREGIYVAAVSELCMRKGMTACMRRNADGVSYAYGFGSFDQYEADGFVA